MGRENKYGELGHVSEKEKELISSFEDMGLTSEQIVKAIMKTRETYKKTVNRSAMGKIVSHIAGLHQLTGVEIEKITSQIAPIINTKISIVSVHRRDGSVFYVPLSKYDSRHTIDAEELAKLVEEFIEKQKKSE